MLRMHFLPLKELRGSHTKSVAGRLGTRLGLLPSEDLRRLALRVRDGKMAVGSGKREKEGGVRT